METVWGLKERLCGDHFKTTRGVIILMDKRSRCYQGPLAASSKWGGMNTRERGHGNKIKARVERKREKEGEAAATKKIGQAEKRNSRRFKMARRRQASGKTS